MSYKCECGLEAEQLHEISLKYWGKRRVCSTCLKIARTEEAEDLELMDDVKKRINSARMFSKDGWKLVNENPDIKKAVKSSDQGINDPDILADGFTEYLIIFREDNDFDDRFHDDFWDSLYDTLLSRWVDYLIHD